jgi:hypothetical protein
MMGEGARRAEVMLVKHFRYKVCGRRRIHRKPLWCPV